MARLAVEGAESIAGMEVRPRMVEQATPEDVLWCDGLASGRRNTAACEYWSLDMFHNVKAAVGQGGQCSVSQRRYLLGRAGDPAQQQ
jgi:hypothetical protein